MRAPALALAAALALALPIQARAADPQWVWHATAPVEFHRLTQLGTLLVSTADGLTTLDSASGAVLWTRGDVRQLKAPDLEELPLTSCGLLHLGEGLGGLERRVESIDFASGARLWDTRALPVETIHGVFPAPQCTLIVLIGAAGKGLGEVALGVDLRTGALRWRQDALFKRAPKLRRVAGSGGMLFRSALAGDMPALLEGPGRMILWVSEDGPLALDLATGRVAWRCAVEGPAPSIATGHAPWMLVGHTVFASFERGLLAIDARSGLEMWHTFSPFPSVAQRMRLTPFGLVVQGSRVRGERGGQEGRPFLDLLDAHTGRSRWLRPPKELHDAGPFTVLGETLYVAADRRLLAVTLADGTTRSIASIALQGHDTVTGLEALDGDLVVTSSQTTMRLSARGEKRYERYDPAPTAPAWARTAAAIEFAVNNVLALLDLYEQGLSGLAGVPGTPPAGPGLERFQGADPALTRRYKASREFGACRVVLTHVAEEGRSGIGLLKIDKASGEVRSRVLLNDRTPDIAYDPIDSRVFYVRDGREIVCYGF